MIDSGELPSNRIYSGCNLGIRDDYPDHENGILSSTIYCFDRFLGHSGTLSLQCHPWSIRPQYFLSCCLHLLPETKIFDNIWNQGDPWRSEFILTLLLHQAPRERSCRRISYWRLRCLGWPYWIVGRASQGSHPHILGGWESKTNNYDWFQLVLSNLGTNLTFIEKY